MAGILKLLLESTERKLERARMKADAEDATARGEGSLTAPKKAKKKDSDKRLPNQPGVGRVTAKGQRIEELTGIKQERINKKKKNK